MKSVQRCSALAQLLVEQNFPAIAIHRGMPQEERSVYDFVWILSQRGLPLGLPSLELWSCDIVELMHHMM